MSLISIGLLTLASLYLGTADDKLCTSSEKILGAAVIFRHGDRTPVKPYPNDPWKEEKLWPVKFGQLTNIGKRQHYAFGKWLRERYSPLLSENYDPSEILVRSTDVDRTLMSAQTNLAGMYPPNDGAVWNINLIWQPIPVHTLPTKDDNVLAMQKNCVAYNVAYNRMKRSIPYVNRLKKFQKLMDYLSVNTGMKVEDYDDINEIFSTLQIEELYNFTLPNWTKSVYPDKLRGPACYSFTTATATPVMARLMVGPLMEQILKNMLHIVYNVKKDNLLMHSLTSHNLLIYSGHDITIANILNALQLFDGKCPVYTSSVIFELVYDESNLTHYIRILYRNFTDVREPYWLEIPKCSKKCPMDRFIQIYEDLITVDWERACGRQFVPLLGMSFFGGLGIFATIYLAHKVYYTTVTNHIRKLRTPPTTDNTLIDSEL